VTCLIEEGGIVGMDKSVLMTAHQIVGLPAEEMKAGWGNESIDAVDGGDGGEVRRLLLDEVLKRSNDRCLSGGGFHMLLPLAAHLGVPTVGATRVWSNANRFAGHRQQATTVDNSSYGGTNHQGLKLLAQPDYGCDRHGCTVNRATHSTRGDGRSVALLGSDTPDPGNARTGGHALSAEGDL